MSGSLNRAQLIGNLGHDPEVHFTETGAKLVTLSVATKESWKDSRSSERRERNEWHRIVIFSEPLADLAERYLTKGAKVFVEGAIRTRKWQDHAGADRYSTEIQLTPFNGTLTFLDRKRDEAQAPAAEDAGASEPGAAGGDHGDPDSGIPF
jgi:single-strand DNA-binding protein